MFRKVGRKRVIRDTFRKIFFVDETSPLVPLLILAIRFLISMVMACSAEQGFWD